MAAAAVEPCRAELGAVRGAAEAEAVAREAAVRVVDHRAVAAVLGGYPEALWGGRRAAAGRAAEVTGVVNGAATPGIVRACRCRQCRAVTVVAARAAEEKAAVATAEVDWAAAKEAGATAEGKAAEVAGKAALAAQES